MTLRSQRLQTMEQVRAFLEGSEAVDYRHTDRGGRLSVRAPDADPAALRDAWEA
ncbi:MAG: hypothetical protein OXF72_07120 [Gammaproteobacteria bacterium]|nr:hypothetical protein [Gammaproteobacteria bacterium]